MDKVADATKTFDLRFLGWVERHPIKIVTLSFSLILLIVISGLIFWYIPSRLNNLQAQLLTCQKAEKEAEAKIPIPPADPDDVGATQSEINEQFDARDGREAEQTSFSKSLNGKNVAWEVEVRSVDAVGENQAYLHFGPPGATSVSRPVSLAVLTGETAKRGLSLKRGDLIRLRGTLSFLDGWLVNVEKTSFEFLRRAGVEQTPK